MAVINLHGPSGNDILERSLNVICALLEFDVIEHASSRRLVRWPSLPQSKSKSKSRPDSDTDSDADSDQNTDTDAD